MKKKKIKKFKRIIRYPLKQGMIVKYISGAFGDSYDDPLWNGKYGNIYGTITEVVRMEYDNELMYDVYWVLHDSIGEYRREDLEKKNEDD